jgi:hypothetical protein
MTYSIKVQTYRKDQPVDDVQSLKIYYDQELEKIVRSIKSLVDAIAEIKTKLAAASSVPIT